MVMFDEASRPDQPVFSTRTSNSFFVVIGIFIAMFPPPITQTDGIQYHSKHNPSDWEKR